MARHHLTFDEQAMLRSWLQANREHLAPLTRGEQLELANKTLQFQITPAQYKKIAIKLKIDRKVVRVKKPTVEAEPRKVTDRDLIDAMEGMGETLAHLVISHLSLVEKLGEKPDKWLLELKERLNLRPTLQ